MKKSKLYRPNKVVGAKKFNARKDRDALYDLSWVKYRIRFLKVNPNCYACGAKAAVVDHLIPHKGDRDLFEKLDNHLPLCKLCHDTVTGLFDAKWSVENFEKKLYWLSSMRVKHGLVNSVKVLGSYR